MMTMDYRVAHRRDGHCQMGSSGVMSTRNRSGSYCSFCNDHYATGLQDDDVVANNYEEVPQSIRAVSSLAAVNAKSNPARAADSTSSASNRSIVRPAT